ncbi:AMP-binding protein [Sphingomonas sp.]|uniref:AMP-binding protein n=1 Tax=Sphingomonas sp. TaxID=28214 RepID=UPI0025F68764|nr:AMP-binding protein [Sphingomonas sp.]
MIPDRPPHIDDHALARPDAVAADMSDGQPPLTYAQLDARSDALAGQLRAAGIAEGDHVALLMPNCPAFLIAAWACHRSGLHYTPVNWHLSADEVRYIIVDSGAKLVLASHSLEMLARQSVGGATLWLCDAAGPSGFAPANGAPIDPVAYSSREGASMLYSSGTSGRPKGIKRVLSGAPFGSWSQSDAMMRDLYGFNSDTVFLCTAPLYHAAPLNFAMSAQRAGGRVILMSAFDAEAALYLIEREGVTVAWLVPTMMTRMLRLPEARRAAADTASLTHVVHAGAPCPVPVKQAMMEWLGPKLYEFYGATEGNGFTAIGPHEWLAHPGSVGRSESVRIVGDDGSELPPMRDGLVYFANTWNPFSYHNDPQKTAEAFDHRGWSTLGDIGHLDADGYLYLTDRQSHMIISGGVNIYPQEIENLLAQHPFVEDAAVIGVPNVDFGEEVKAVVQLIAGVTAGVDAERVLIAWCRERIAHFKAPRSVDFVDALPRMPTGKLFKRELIARYRSPTGPI